MNSVFAKAGFAVSICAALIVTGAAARNFNIPAGSLEQALDAYAAQTGASLIISDEHVKGAHTRGVAGNLSDNTALAHILSGTGFVVHAHPDGALAIVSERSSSAADDLSSSIHTAAAPAATVSGAALETVTVTSSKIGGDVQNIPISITALSQEQLTTRQVAGGPDLVKEVPNLTFSKTNFTGYNIEIRGIGTQAISATTDPAVAVAFNDIPFIRNHFFEQEFYDVSQAEVLRGPQGTLYGRNATAGVVNIVSAKPTDQFEAMISVDMGNYQNRRFEGMINVPIVDDRLDLRVAGEWTKRNGYSFNELTNVPIDGRDLWSSRTTLSWNPFEKLRAYLIWEHFQEDDDRIRSSKQLCKNDPTPVELDGIPTSSAGNPSLLSQGCQMGSLYAPDAFQVPNGHSLPYYYGLEFVGGLVSGIDPYASTMQSHNLRVIQSALNPIYRAKNDILELNADYEVAAGLTLSSQTAFNHDSLYSAEDFNRFNTAPGIFLPGSYSVRRATAVSDDGTFCDPQLGCSNRLVAEDLSNEYAWQLSQEVRIASKFNGPFNFSFGGNFLHYETEENYYVFINSLTLLAALPAFGDVNNLSPWVPGVSDNHECLQDNGGYKYPDPSKSTGVLECGYIDPNPINRLNNQGHNYFLSQNPYTLNSYAGFGEAYYTVTPDVKLTGGLRWTGDHKHFVDIPSELLVGLYGYPTTGTVDQQWNEWTGRFAANWTPKLDFTDQTLVYGSFAHGYKAGGANPPGAVLLIYNSGDIANPSHPRTFKPEFIDAFEFGSKNTLLDGALTLNGDIFFYNYKNYQISEIVDRTAINLNFNATVKGAELETTWEPSPGLKFTFAGGYEATKLANGSQAIDLMDRTAGHPGWIVVKPFVTQASNCILPIYVVKWRVNWDSCSQAYVGTTYPGAVGPGGIFTGVFGQVDPITGLPYVENPTVTNYLLPPGYPGFDPHSVDPNAPADVNNGLGLPPNNGQGFDKDLSGKELPNAPHFTVSLTGEYTLPITQDWAATLHGDFYWQASSWARVFNDNPYDQIRGYSTSNLALIFTNQDGWQVIGYVKNIFNVTAITGDFLNSDDTGLTTNVFLTDPRLFGIRVTKNW